MPDPSSQMYPERLLAKDFFYNPGAYETDGSTDPPIQEAVEVVPAVNRRSSWFSLALLLLVEVSSIETLTISGACQTDTAFSYCKHYFGAWGELFGNDRPVLWLLSSTLLLWLVVFAVCRLSRLGNRLVAAFSLACFFVWLYLVRDGIGSPLALAFIAAVGAAFVVYNHRLAEPARTSQDDDLD